MRLGTFRASDLKTGIMFRNVCSASGASVPMRSEALRFEILLGGDSKDNQPQLKISLQDCPNILAVESDLLIGDTSACKPQFQFNKRQHQGISPPPTLSESP